MTQKISQVMISPLAPFSGGTIPDNSTVHEALQALENGVENIPGTILTDLSSTQSGKGSDLIGARDGAAGSLWTTLQGFIDRLLSNTGSSIIGFIQAGTGAVMRSIQTKLRGRPVSPEDFGATGDGSTDDSVAIQAAIATGKDVVGEDGKTYAIGSQLVFAANYQTLKLNLKMLTDTGKFDRSTYGGGFASNQTGVIATGKTAPRFEGVIEMVANAGVRTVNPIAFRSCNLPYVDVEVYNFTDAEFALVTWDSNFGGHARVYAHDCNPNTTSLGSVQLTAFGVDYNRPNGNSIGYTFDVVAKNILHGPSAAQQYGYQSDAVNIQTTGYSGARGRVYADKVGEPFDCFGDGVIADIVCTNAYEYGLKLIHGAENGIFRITVNGFRRYGVVLGSDNTTKSVRRNRIYATVSGGGDVAKTDFVANVASSSATITVTSITAGLNIAVGDVVHDNRFPAGTTISALGTGTGGTGTYTASNPANASATGISMKTSPAPTAAVATDGTSGIYKPTDNYVELSYTGDGVRLDYGVLETSGSRNTYRINGSGHARKISQIDGTAGSGVDASRMQHDRKTFVRAYAAAQSVAPGSFVQLQYTNEVQDMTGEFDPTTFTFTATSERDIVLMASGRTGGATDQKEYDIQVKKNSSEIFRKQCRVSGNGDFSFDTGPVLTHVSPGDTITVYLNHNESAAINISSSEAFSRFHIWELS